MHVASLPKPAIQSVTEIPCLERGKWQRRRIVLKRVALAAGIEAEPLAPLSGIARDRRRPELTVTLFHPTLKLGNILRSCEVFITAGPVGISQPAVEAF
jgi:hypothetical protein